MRKITFLFILLGLFFFSCKKKLNIPSWDVGILGPVANTSLDISNLLADSLLQVNEDNSLTFVYSNSVFSLTLDSVVQIPDTLILYDFPWIYGTTTLNPNQNLFNDTQETKYELNNVELVKAILRTGTIRVEFESSIDEDVEVLYEIPIAIKDGNPFSVTELAVANSITTKTYDLSGYILDLRGKDLNDYNTFITRYNVKIASNANPVQVTNGDYVRIRNYLSDVVPEYAKGYFGQTSASIGPSAEHLDIFTNYIGGTLDLESVDLILRIKNEMGLDIQSTLSSLKSINNFNNTSVNLNHAIIGSAINLNRASEGNNSVYPPIFTSSYEISMDNSNSNADQFIENLPDQLEYKLDVDLNPNGNVSGDNDFIYYGTGIDFSVDLEFPLYFSSNAITLQDTGIFDFGEPDTLHPNRYSADGFLYLYAYNGFPLDAEVQLYTLDSNFALMDTLIAEGGEKINAAPLDIYNKVIEKKRSRIDIPVSKVLVDNLYDARYIIFKVSLTTASIPDHIHIYSNYSIDFKLIADVTYTIDID